MQHADDRDDENADFCESPVRRQECEQADEAQNLPLSAGLTAGETNVNTLLEGTDDGQF